MQIYEIGVSWHLILLKKINYAREYGELDDFL